MTIHTHIKASLSAFVGLALLAQGPIKDFGGTITGRVIDETEKPVRSAKITLLGLESGRLLHRAIQTNDTGEFVAKGVPWGSYMICAEKEEDGYPSNLALLYTTFPSPTAILMPALPTRDVTVRLGPKAGVIQFVSVTDAATGKKVELDSVVLKRVDDGAVVEVTPKHEMFVPALKKVYLEVKAAGYSSWFYPGTTDQAKQVPLELRSSQRVPITISLLPLVQ